MIYLYTRKAEGNENKETTWKDMDESHNTNLSERNQ